MPTMKMPNFALQNSTNLWRDKLFILTIALCLTGSAGCVWLSIKHFVDIVDRSTQHSSLNALSVAPADVSTPNLQSISKLAWFGVAKDEEANDLAASKDISFANLELKGISLTANPSFAGAYIAEKSKEENFYRVGEALPNGAGYLAQIFSDHVSIKSSGQLALLYFAGAKAPIVTAAEAKASPFFIAPAPLQPMPQMSVPEIIKRFTSDPDALIAQAGLQSVEQGQKKGYHFNGLDVQGVFDGSNLKKDDVILGIDGNAVGDPKLDRLLVLQLAFAQKLKLDIRRGDKNITIDYIVPTE